MDSFLLVLKPADNRPDTDENVGVLYRRTSDPAYLVSL